MKHFIYLMVVLGLAISAKAQSMAFGKTSDTSEICWSGTINEKTPILLHYHLESNLIIGEITYLNTKARIPIKVLGTVEQDKSFRLLEFEKDGNITGIITGTVNNKSFKGSWFSPRTRKEFTLSLETKDSIFRPIETNVNVNDIFGRYHYQFSEDGYQGDLVIAKLQGSKAAFEISCVTGSPARNIAQIDKDTITLKTNRFIYNLPNTKDCEFEVKFYKGFAYIKYTKGNCDGQFGHNASVVGLFLKIE